ncbi:hypothetical protein [Mycoplasma amphoriforme]
MIWTCSSYSEVISKTPKGLSLINYYVDVVSQEVKIEFYADVVD